MELTIYVVDDAQFGYDHCEHTIALRDGYFFVQTIVMMMVEPLHRSSAGALSSMENARTSHTVNRIQNLEFGIKKNIIQQ